MGTYTQCVEMIIQTCLIREKWCRGGRKAALILRASPSQLDPSFGQKNGPKPLQIRPGILRKRAALLMYINDNREGKSENKAKDNKIVECENSEKTSLTISVLRHTHPLYIVTCPQKRR